MCLLSQNKKLYTRNADRICRGAPVVVVRKVNVKSVIPVERIVFMINTVAFWNSAFDFMNDREYPNVEAEMNKFIDKVLSELEQCSKK